MIAIGALCAYGLEPNLKIVKVKVIPYYKNKKRSKQDSEAKKINLF
jgi:hypothetical protein